MERMGNPCEPSNYCADADDYRPIQSTLLTRFALAADSSESWRTTNQDYGAFYYRNAPQYCVPDALKAKIHRRHNRFQDWMLYQSKCQPRNTSMNNNNQAIFPSNRNQTVRITHRKKFLPNCEDMEDRSAFSPCGEDGLITEYIVKKILLKLQCLINPGEYYDVLQCAKVLARDILTGEPSVCADEIVDRVVTIMISPPNVCPPPTMKPSVSKCDLPVSTSVSVSEPFLECNQPIPISNVFNKLTDLEDAICKISGRFVQA